jgi:hypothetical protein
VYQQRFLSLGTSFIADVLVLFTTDFTKFVPDITSMWGTTSRSTLGTVDGSWLRIKEMEFFGFENKIFIQTTDRLLCVQEF